MVTEAVERSGEEQFVNVAGIRTYYRMVGEGPPVALLHGNEENLFDWSWIMPTLARTRRVYALDFPGTGKSEKPAVEYSTEFFTKFLEAFLDAIGRDRAALVGNSLGVSGLSRWHCPDLIVTGDAYLQEPTSEYRTLVGARTGGAVGWAAGSPGC